jgi:ferredoxin-like protein FixX
MNINYLLRIFRHALSHFALVFFSSTLLYAADECSFEPGLLNGHGSYRISGIHWATDIPNSISVEDVEILSEKNGCDGAQINLSGTFSSSFTIDMEYLTQARLSTQKVEEVKDKLGQFMLCEWNESLENKCSEFDLGEFGEKLKGLCSSHCARQSSNGRVCVQKEASLTTGECEVNDDELNDDGFPLKASGRGIGYRRGVGFWLQASFSVDGVFASQLSCSCSPSTKNSKHGHIEPPRPTAGETPNYH